MPMLQAGPNVFSKAWGRARIAKVSPCLRLAGLRDHGLERMLWSAWDGALHLRDAVNPPPLYLSALFRIHLGVPVCLGVLTAW